MGRRLFPMPGSHTRLGWAACLRHGWLTTRDREGRRGGRAFCLGRRRWILPAIFKLPPFFPLFHFSSPDNAFFLHY